MSYEFDCWHATTAMAGAVQSALHQSDSEAVGRLGADVRHSRACGPPVGQGVPYAIERCSARTTAWPSCSPTAPTVTG